MPTYGEHLKSILCQILASYEALRAIQDRPGDLKSIKMELLRINGFLRVVANNIKEEKIQMSGFGPLKKKFLHYLANYYFEQEIDMILEIYPADTHRIKNIRIMILDALEDRKMMKDTAELADEI